MHSPTLTGPGAVELHETSRGRIAAAILALVAEYGGAHDDYQALLSEDLPLLDGETPVLAAERLVRQHAGEAESRSFGSRVITGDLASAFLLDDYLRIRAVEQHLAFDDPFTGVEEDALVQRREDQVLEAQERAAWWAQHAREQQRRCACGHPQSSHPTQSDVDRILGRQPIRPQGCFGFRVAFDDPVSRVRPSDVPAVLENWLTYHGRTVDPQWLNSVLGAVAHIRSAAPHTPCATAFQTALATVG